MLDLGTLGSQTDRQILLKLVALLTRLIAAQHRDGSPSSTPSTPVPTGRAAGLATPRRTYCQKLHLLSNTPQHGARRAVLLQQGHTWRPLCRRCRRRHRLCQPTTPRRHHRPHCLQVTICAVVRSLPPSFRSQVSAVEIRLHP